MTTRLVAGLVAGLTLTATASLAVPATAEGPSTAADGRLPFQREVAQVVPDAAGGDRVLRPGTGIRGPSDGTADVYDEPCLGERTVVRGETGRAAAYRPGPGADERPVRPVVQERTFASPAAARAALGDVRRVVRPCGGETARTRTETYRWYVRSMPRYGADRLSWSLRTDDIENRGVVDLHQLVLRGDTLVHVVTTRKGGLPDQAATSRLTRLALDTL